jgi:threonylcarbamoyladenosine tRNA methylthiotransferase MtaB
MNFEIKTFGCKVNTYDSGLLQKKLQNSGLKSDSQTPNVYILNSCAVTAQATKDVLKQAGQLKMQNPQATIVLTGCAAQVDGKLIDEAQSVDLVIANSHKNDFSEILSDFLIGKNNQKVFRSNIFRNENLGEGGGEELSHTRSYLKIQDGCNSFCSFCVIPFARGKSRSLTVTSIIKRIKELEAQGINEVVLTGVHIGDYCDEETYGGPFKLDDLVEQVLNNTLITRIRLTSLEPVELSEKLMRLFKNPKMCPHFHMSLQSLSTEVLSGMRRNYNADQVGEALNWIANDFPNAFVGLDVITGFPGETDTLFAETLNNLKKWPWTRIHVFPFSERGGTRAEKMPDSVPWHIRKERAKILRDLSAERFNQRAIDQIGQVKEVLVLKEKKQMIQSLSQDYWDVFVDSKEISKKGELKKVKVRGYERNFNNRMNGVLVGEFIS